MDLDSFLHNLHFDIGRVRPSDAVVDFADAPLPFKLYQGLPSVSLPRPVGQVKRISSDPNEAMDKVQHIARVLWYGYGLTQLAHVVAQVDSGNDDARLSTMQMLRRYVPSGGGLYPSELYAYLKVESLPSGIYHYDVAHHGLVLLREGNFDDYLNRAIGLRADVSHDVAVLIVSTMFWKNFYKYNNFGYRLQGLDAGVLIGQLLELAKQVGYEPRVCFQFLDRAINHLLGLDESEESAYALISLKSGETAEYNTPGAGEPQEIGPESAGALCQEISKLNHRHYTKSKRISPYPMLVRMNRASMLETTSAFIAQPPATIQHDAKHPATSRSLSSVLDSRRNKSISLPPSEKTKVDYATACRKRYSPGFDFVLSGMNLSDLSTLFSTTFQSFSYLNDLEPCDAAAAQVSIGLCVHGVSGLEDGAYLYNSETHSLRLVQKGDHRYKLQQGMSMPTVNLYHTPLCVHLISSRDHCRKVFGFRGYRIQQMQVGIVLQRLLLSAAALGLGGHPLLDYDEGACDRLYHLDDTGLTCLVQVPIGKYRKSSRFEGPLV